MCLRLCPRVRPRVQPTSSSLPLLLSLPASFNTCLRCGCACSLGSTSMDSARVACPHCVRVCIVWQALRKKGIMFIVAPFEADPQLAFLCREGIVDAVVTEDSDLVLWGSLKVRWRRSVAGAACAVMWPCLRLTFGSVHPSVRPSASAACACPARVPLCSVSVVMLRRFHHAYVCVWRHSVSMSSLCWRRPCSSSVLLPLLAVRRPNSLI